MHAQSAIWAGVVHSLPPALPAASHRTAGCVGEFVCASAYGKGLTCALGVQQRERTQEKMAQQMSIQTEELRAVTSPLYFNVLL